MDVCLVIKQRLEDLGLHSNAGSKRLGLCWWQTDLGWYFIHAAESLRLASHMKRPRA